MKSPFFMAESSLHRGGQAAPCTSFPFIVPPGRTKLFEIQDSHPPAKDPLTSSRGHAASSCSYEDNNPVATTTGPKTLGGGPRFPGFVISARSALFLRHVCAFADGYKQYCY